MKLKNALAILPTFVILVSPIAAIPAGAWPLSGAAQKPYDVHSKIQSVSSDALASANTPEAAQVMANQQTGNLQTEDRGIENREMADHGTASRGTATQSIVNTQGSTNSAPASAGLVRTVSVPGGMSTEMRSALQSLEGLFARSSKWPRSVENRIGMTMLDLEGGFLNVYVARLNGDGTVGGACVSSLEEALGVLRPHDPSEPELVSTGQPTVRSEGE